MDANEVPWAPTVRRRPQSFIRYWMLCWRCIDNPRKSCCVQIVSLTCCDGPTDLSLSHFACWYKLKSRSDISCKKSVIIGDFILFYFSKLYYNIVYFCYLKIFNFKCLCFFSWMILLFADRIRDRILFIISYSVIKKHTFKK